jgi:signal transduction histidine kinase
VNQETVLIIADDAEFPRNVMGRWQSERKVPAFTLLGSELWKGSNAARYDLALVGGIRNGRLPIVLDSLEAGLSPAIYVPADSQSVAAVRSSHPKLLVLPPHDGWLDSLILLSTEALRHAEAVARARRAETNAAKGEREATLGRYMLEQRHGMNNALTSVLGNAELLLLEPGALTAEIREQVETMHSMALRMHEIMQRFSSLESELNFAEKQSQRETERQSHRAATGT